jgi:[ribosomal protein S5]-alanine N-acetyltransferase
MKLSEIVQVFPEFETERLVLRELSVDDLDSLFLIFSNDQVLRYYDIDPIRTKKQAESLFRYWYSRFYLSKGIRWAISFKNQKHVMIGTCGFINLSLTNRVAEIGYELLPSYWNKGIMSEALNALTIIGFDVFKLNCLEAKVFKENVASIRVLEKNRFKLEGVLRERVMWRSLLFDVKVYSLLKKENYKSL